MANLSLETRTRDCLGPAVLGFKNRPHSAGDPGVIPYISRGLHGYTSEFKRPVVLKINPVLDACA